ncbi:MAG TPA: hypothetical protein VFK13_00220 [Gemmatimonadaceae bacterium]|nr:hypothetical protein [Gemmatimonadaceae bacterium]
MKPTLRIAILSVAAAAAASTAGCGDLTGLDASFRVFEDTVTVFALSGSPVTAPVAINTIQGTAVRAEPTSGFDILFDITPEGQGEILPPAALGLGGRAGVLVSTQDFDDIGRAADGGYEENNPTLVNVGDVLVVRAASSACAGLVNPFIYSKLEILDIDPDARTFRVRLRVDPNCGFRSFGEGVPDD